MSSPEAWLPDLWVERIFAAMRATYGAAFDRQWECPQGVEPAVHAGQTKAYWARELGRFRENPDAIRYGLDNLPPHPPNLIEFRQACARMPHYVAPALPAPDADPARVAQVVAGIKRPEPRDPRAWAWRLKAREEANPRSLSIAQSTMWRDALASVIARQQRDLEEEEAA